MLTITPLKSLVSILLVCKLGNCLISDFLFFSDMFLAAGENHKAIEIIGQHGWVEK